MMKHFDSLADTWWNPDGPMKALHQINPARCEFIKHHFQLSNNAKILDLGCGAGILTESLQKQFPNLDITGIDTSQPCIQAAQYHDQSNAITYAIEDSRSHLKKNRQCYDAITCLEMLEHVENPEHIIEDIYHLLKPNGICIFSTLDRNLYSYLFAICAAEHLFNLVPKGTHRHDWFIRPAELDRQTRSLKLKRLDLKGISYNPISGQAELSDYISINYIAAYQK